MLKLFPHRNELDPARCVDVEPSDMREILTFFYPPFEDSNEKVKLSGKKRVKRST
jgi:hypothetical protein